MKPNFLTNLFIATVFVLSGSASASAQQVEVNPEEYCKIMTERAMQDGLGRRFGETLKYSSYDPMNRAYRNFYAREGSGEDGTWTDVIRPDVLPGVVCFMRNGEGYAEGAHLDGEFNRVYGNGVPLGWQTAEPSPYKPQ